MGGTPDELGHAAPLDMLRNCGFLERSAVLTGRAPAKAKLALARATSGTSCPVCSGWATWPASLTSWICSPIARLRPIEWIEITNVRRTRHKQQRAEAGRSPPQCCRRFNYTAYTRSMCDLYSMMRAPRRLRRPVPRAGATTLSRHHGDATRLRCASRVEGVRMTCAKCGTCIVRHADSARSFGGGG